MHTAELPAIATINFKKDFSSALHGYSGVDFHYAICQVNATTRELEIVGISYPNKKVEETILSTHYACNAALAYKKTDLAKYSEVCDEYGLDADLLQYWKDNNGIADEKDANERLKKISHYVNNYEEVIAERLAAADAKHALRKAA